MAERTPCHPFGGATILTALTAVVAQSAGGGEDDGQVGGKGTEALDGVRHLQRRHFALHKDKDARSGMKLQRILVSKAGPFAGVGREADLGHLILFHE